jgi:hypothetical protein
MDAYVLSQSLTTLFSELVDGAPISGAYVLNRGDQGLLRSLDRLNAEAASAVPSGGSSIAAHVDHLRYGISLMNRWATGEDPFSDADWGVSWRRTQVDEREWVQLRADLREETHRWLQALRRPRELDEVELNGVIGSVVHLAYHVGAIRQMDRTARGPAANDPAPEATSRA